MSFLDSAVEESGNCSNCNCCSTGWDGTSILGVILSPFKIAATISGVFTSNLLTNSNNSSFSFNSIRLLF